MTQATKTIRVRVSLVIEVDAAAWAEGAGLVGTSAKSVSDDIRDYVHYSVSQLASIDDAGATVEIGR